MGLYSKNALLVMTYEDHVVDGAKLAAKPDAAIVMALKGDTYVPHFRENTDEFTKAGVPVLAYVEINPTLYAGDTFMEDGSNLPQGLKEPHVKALRDALHYNSGLSVKIYGIVVDFSRYLDDDGKTIWGQGWIKNIARNVVQQMFNYFGLQVYPLAKKSLFAKYPDTGGPIANLINSPAWNGASTVEIAQKPVLENGFYRPGDTDGPLPPINSNWFLWWYGSQTLSGVTAPVVLFLASKQTNAFYKDIGYAAPKPPPAEPPNPNPDPNPNPQPSGYKAILIGALVAAVDAFATAWLQGRHG